MVKKDLIANLRAGTGLSTRECIQILERFFEIIKKSLADGQDVKLSGLGLFTVQHRKTWKGRSPNTGERIEIPERKVLTFRLSHVLKEKINGRGHSSRTYILLERDTPEVLQ